MAVDRKELRKLCKLAASQPRTTLKDLVYVGLGPATILELLDEFDAADLTIRNLRCTLTTNELMSLKQGVVINGFQKAARFFHRGLSVDYMPEQFRKDLNALLRENRGQIRHIEHLQTQLAAAEAILAKLPETADGVRVVPGMIVYYTYGDLVALPLRVQDYKNWTVFSEGKVLPWAEGEHKGQFMLFYVHNCYSTEKAALAAKEKEDGQPKRKT